MTIDSSGNVEISGSGNGVVFPDRTVQTSASAPTWSQKLADAERFTLVLSREAVLDNETGLVWERRPNATKTGWASACVYCNDGEVGGRFGWRLPTVEELSSLVDRTELDPTLPADHPFIGVQTESPYWTIIFPMRAPRLWAGPCGFSMAKCTPPLRAITRPQGGVFEADLDTMLID